MLIAIPWPPTLTGQQDPKPLPQLALFSGFAQVAADPPGQPKQDLFIESVVAAIARFETDKLTQGKLVAAVRARSQEQKWLVSFDDGRRAAIVTERFPSGTSVVHLPARARTAKSRAIDEVVKAEATRDLLAKVGLDDPAATDATIEAVCREGTVAGKLKPSTLISVRDEEVVVGLAIAEQAKVQAAWIDSHSQATLFQHYRTSIVSRYLSAISRQSHHSALKDIQHLMSKPFAGADDYIAATNCYIALGDPTNANITLRKAISLDQSKTSVDFLVAIGDRALELDIEGSHETAELAFATALERLQSNQ